MTLLAGGVYLLLNLVGLVLAISRWNTHPIASVLVISATGLAILGRVAQVALMRTLTTDTYWNDSSAPSACWDRRHEFSAPAPRLAAGQRAGELHV